MDKNWKYAWAALLVIAAMGFAIARMWPGDLGLAEISAANHSDAIALSRDAEDEVIVARFSYDAVPEHLRAPFARVVPVAALLHKAGYSHYVFSRLVDYPAELRVFAQALTVDEDPYARKLAAYSLGYRMDAVLDDFLLVYEAELERERTGDFMEQFNAQSTVEDLVFSAVRLVRDGRRPEAGLSFLERVVSDTVSEEHYWNSSNYAMASLLHTDAEQYGPLFEAWSEFVDGSQDDAPIEHSFMIERGWRDAMREGITGQIYEMFDREESMAADAVLQPADQLAVEDLLNALAGVARG